MVVCQIYNGIFMVKTFLPPTVPYNENTLLHASSITARTKLTVRNTGRVNCPSCVMEIMVFSLYVVLQKFCIDGLLGKYWLNLVL